MNNFPGTIRAASLYSTVDKSYDVLNSCQEKQNDFSANLNFSLQQVSGLEKDLTSDKTLRPHIGIHQPYNIHVVSMPIIKCALTLIHMALDLIQNVRCILLLSVEKK